MSIAFIVLRLVHFWSETGAARVTSLDELRLAHNRSSFLRCGLGPTCFV
jgi:hypothetical protein